MPRRVSRRLEVFEAGGLFFGDYNGLAAYGGRVYCVWTEKPAPAPVPDEKKSEETKDAKPQPKGAIVKVGTADFTSTAQPGGE